MKRVWYIDPHSGGEKISPQDYNLIVAQAVAYETKQAWYPKFKLQLQFKNQFCYLAGIKEGKEAFPIGRLRYFGSNRWSLAFYAYSNESYKPCLFPDGGWFGTLENAINICSVYLTD